jgi:NRAMP (natural resistance-associated macrophage protein)-like metal ion transporter
MKTLKKLMRYIGPGFITGASDDDPSGIGTYSQTGAQFGYQLLWTSLFSFPFMSAIQEMCGRIGLVTGKGLASVMKKHYSKPVLYFMVIILLVANTINIGADLGAMASALQLITGVRFEILLLLITVITLLMEVFISYKTYSKYLKYLTFSLFSYIIAVFVVKQDWTRIAVSTIMPTFSFSRDYILTIVAILGTTISPYLFFWQADEEVEEEIAHHKLRIMGVGKPHITKSDISVMRIDTLVGMFFSNVVMFFIIVTTASTLHLNGITTINTAQEAAETLKPIAGNLASLLFTIGIIGTGLLAVPVLAGSASYAISETLGWKEGLYRKFNRAHGFYGVISIATIMGLAINFINIPPFRMLYYTAVLNGICAPPLLIMILLIANNKQIMDKYVNSKLLNVLGITITFLMILAALAVFLF